MPTFGRRLCAASRVYAVTVITLRPAASGQPLQAAPMRDHAHTLSDFRTPTCSIECEPCGRRGRYNVARLMEKYGDAKLPELRHVLANCPKAKSHSIHDQVQGQVRRGQPVLSRRQPQDVLTRPLGITIACPRSRKQPAKTWRLLKRGPADSRRAGPFAFIFPAANG